MVVTGHFNPSADGKLTGGFQTGICIRPAETENGETGIIALFFYADGAKNSINDLAGRFPDGTCPVPDPLIIPLHDIAEGRRHVFRMCGVLVTHIVRKTVVRCQTIAFVIDLYETVCDPQINLLLRVLIRAGIPVLLINNMEVKVDGPAIDPFSYLIRDIRKRTKEFLFFLKNLIAAAFALLESLMVELIELICNALLEVCEGVVYVIPALGDDGGSDLTDRALYGRFLLRFSDACGHNRSHVVRAKSSVIVSQDDLAFLRMGHNAGPEIIAYCP